MDFSKISNEFGNSLSDIGGTYKKTVDGFTNNARKALGLGGSSASSATSSNTASDKPVTRNLSYTVFITQPDSDRHVLAYLPDTFNFDLQSEYSAPLAESLSKSAVVDSAMKLLGISTVTQQMTAQYWSGSTHVSFNLPLVFVATSNKDEIMGPIGKLIEMSLPSRVSGGEATGFLVAPGARYVPKEGVDLAAASKDLIGTSISAAADAAIGVATLDATKVNEIAKKLSEFSNRNIKLHNKISIVIGNFLYFDNVVIKNVQQTFASRFDSDGYPMKVDVSVTIETMMAPTAQDMLNSFKGIRPTDSNSASISDQENAKSTQQINDIRNQQADSFKSESTGIPAPNKTWQPNQSVDPGMALTLRTLLG